MKLTGNTILITGGGSGIGRGLAEAFHRLGNQVIIAGRRKGALNETTTANPGMVSMPLNIEDPDSIRALATHLSVEHPALNVLINNAGIMRREDLLQPSENAADAESMIATNLLGPIRLTAAVLPTLRHQASAVVMNVSSGLAFVPLHLTPTYCATKAAIHSYTQSLRYQLRDSRIEVLELIPPYVATDLLDGREDPRAMPLDQFIAETMDILRREPDAKEICVENVQRLRYAAEGGNYSGVFEGLNGGVAAASH